MIKDKKTNLQKGKKTTRQNKQKKKKDKRQRPKREFNIVTSGQFRTLAMFSPIIIVGHHPGNCISDLSDMQIYLKQLTLSSKGSTANDMGIHGHGAQSPSFYQTLETQSVDC